MTEYRNSTRYRPPTVSPPGGTLADLLEEKGITQADLARRLERPVKTINEIVKGKAAITPDTALQLERALGAPADFWLAREAAYREWLARERARADLTAWATWLQELPIREMTSLGWIPRPVDKPEAVLYCLRFFGVASPEAWRETYARPLAAFRAPGKLKRDKGAVSAWLRRGEIEASMLRLNAFDHSALAGRLEKLRRLTTLTTASAFLPKLQEVCGECGVAVILVPAPRGCPASGAARWLAPDRALIQLSLRYKTHDQLWFTFFHELAHILKHGKSLTFIDEANQGSNTQAEKEANEFARDLLIPPFAAERLKTIERSRRAVAAFAEELGIAPGIVVGRMQNDLLLPWSHLNDLKHKYDWPSQ